MGAPDLPFTRAQSIEAGHEPAAIRRLLRRGEWVQLRRGVYVLAWVLAEAGDDPQRRHALDVAGLLLALGSDAVAAGTSAARILGLETLQELPCELVVVTGDPRVRGERRDGYVVRAADLPRHHRSARFGVPITSAARTVTDLARKWPLRDAVVLADSALRLGRTSIVELDEVLAYCAGWPGIDSAQCAVALADPRAESVLESISRVAMHDEGVPTPRSQVVIGGARVDFLWDDLAVIGEADGLGKYAADGRQSTRDIVRAEKRREELLADAGYEIVRWGWEDACRPRRLAHRLHAAFARGIERQRGRLTG